MPPAAKVHILIPRNYKCVASHAKGTSHMWLRSRILNWGEYSGLSEWPSVITRVLQMGQPYLAAKNQRETAVAEDLMPPYWCWWVHGDLCQTSDLHNCKVKNSYCFKPQNCRNKKLKQCALFSFHADDCSPQNEGSSRVISGLPTPSSRSLTRIQIKPGLMETPAIVHLRMPWIEGGVQLIIILYFLDLIY